MRGNAYYSGQRKAAHASLRGKFKTKSFWLPYLTQKKTRATTHVWVKKHGLTSCLSARFQIGLQVCRTVKHSMKRSKIESFCDEK